jgi:hypothetical protein
VIPINVHSSFLSSAGICNSLAGGMIPALDIARSPQYSRSLFLNESESRRDKQSFSKYQVRAYPDCPNLEDDRGGERSRRKSERTEAHARASETAFLHSDGRKI